MQSLQTAGLDFGSGAPKICVPLTSPALPALTGELSAAQALPADLYEWRADAFSGDWAPALNLLRERARRPVLCTLRTKGQGGGSGLDPAGYEEALSGLMGAEGAFQLIDIELACGGERVRGLVEQAHARGLGAVVSYHDFAATPEKAQMVRLLGEMKSLGADLPKLAVMPACPGDVLALMEATLEASLVLGPVVTMSMGALGRISRVCGELTGSCMTFGAGVRASAPGQLGARALRDMLDNCTLCHREGEGQAYEK